MLDKAPIHTCFLTTKTQNFLRKEYTCQKNETVDEINEYIMSQIEGEEVMYHRSDVCKASTSSSMKPNDIFHQLEVPWNPKP